MAVLKCALPKGNNKEIGTLLHAAGISVPPDIDESRKYIVRDHHIEFILVKPMDVPIIVEYGAADIGIAGKDVLLEQKREVIELLNLGTNSSRLAVFSLRKELPAYGVTIGTGYPRIANAFFVSRGTQANVITLSGDLKNVVSFRLVDCIVDLDQQRNVDESLHELEMITYVTDRLIVNRVSYILKYPEIESVCAALSLVI